MTATEVNPVLEFELRHPQQAAALWDQVTDGSRVTVSTSEAAMLYRELVLQRLATRSPVDGTDLGARS